MFYTYKKAPKSTKKHKKYKSTTKQKYENASKQTKIKNVLKKQSHLFAYWRFCASEEKNRKASTLEMWVSLN